MESIRAVLGLALLPALGNFAGGLLAEFSFTTGKLLNKALHGATGLITGAAAIELIPEALAWGWSMGRCLSTCSVMGS